MFRNAVLKLVQVVHAGAVKSGFVPGKAASTSPALIR